MAALLQHLFGELLQPGVDPMDHRRQGPLDAETVPELGRAWQSVEREEEARLMLKAADLVYQRQQGGMKLDADTLKKLPAFIGVCSAHFAQRCLQISEVS